MVTSEVGEERRLRWGVISTANIGRVAVIPAIQASRNGELVAVASRDAARARTFAIQAGIPRHYGDYAALLEDDEIDAVYVPLPNAQHFDWTIRALGVGKHVLCEKPLALDEAECREMAAVGAEHGVRLMEAFMYRFHPRTERVLERVRAGDVGRLRMIRSSFTFRLTRSDNIRWSAPLGGGALMDVGCYCVNVSRLLAGAEPLEVSARAVWAESGVDAELVGTMVFPDDVLAHFDCALTMERNEACEVAGTGGVMRVPASFLPGTGDAPIYLQRGRAPMETEIVTGADEYRLMVEHFGDGVLGGAELRYTAEEAALNLRTIRALLRSAREEGRPVTVGPE